MAVSEHQPVIVSNLSSILTRGVSALSGNVRVNMDGKAEDPQSPEPAYNVTISREARDHQARAKENTQKTTEDEPPESISSGLAADEASEGGQALSRIDAQIKILQEKIKEVKEKIAALADDDSKEAEQQRTALEAQLFELTSQLMTLLDKKMGSG